MPGTNDAKRALRREMRSVRRQAAGVPGRSEAIVERLVAMPEVAGVHVVMLFEPVPGEPDLRGFADWCRCRGVEVVVPDASPLAAFSIAPDRLDVVVVPGLAFNRSGHRLGHGVGWYDRFLAGVDPTCVTIGVCFDEQLLDDLPVEQHDVGVRWVVTPTRVIQSVAHPGSIQP